MAGTKKKKAATPPSMTGVMIRVLKPEKRLGVRKAQAASEVFHLYGAKTRVVAETLTMYVEMPETKTLRQINQGLAELGLRLVKSTRVAAAYEWRFGDPIKKREEAE